MNVIITRMIDRWLIYDVLPDKVSILATSSKVELLLKAQYR